MTPDPDREPDGSLRLAQPPPHYVGVREWSLSDLTQLRHVRTAALEEVAMRTEVRDELPPGQVARNVGLIVSELATNALEHAGAPTTVTLHQHHTSFLVAVTDHRPATGPHLASYRPPGAGGFGLRIVRELAHDLAWFRTDNAKTVWAEITS